MMFLCTSRFDLEEQQRKEMEKFFSLDEIEAAKEENDEGRDELEAGVISDTEEHDAGFYNLIEVDEEEEQDDSDSGALQLPETSTQLRTSGRKRKSREDDGFEHY
jgi:hypothetical protein